jgi:hypothetical protein
VLLDVHFRIFGVEFEFQTNCLIIDPAIDGALGLFAYENSKIFPGKGKRVFGS